jgi:hypothetical protein
VKRNNKLTMFLVTLLSFLAPLMAAEAQDLSSNTTTEEASPEPEIVVIGRKLQKWRGQVKMSDSTLRCVTKKSTGDNNIDAIGCRVLLECIRQELPKLKQAYGTPKKIRKDQTKAAFKQLDSCVVPKRKELIEQYLRNKAGN